MLQNLTEDNKVDENCTISILFLTKASALFQAEGYTDGDLTLFHSFTITAFLKAENPVDFLAKASEVRGTTSTLAKSNLWTN